MKGWVGLFIPPGFQQNFAFTWFYRIKEEDKKSIDLVELYLGV
jgi:hypothetical protein